MTTTPARQSPSTTAPAGADGEWLWCLGCEGLVYRRRLERNLRVCPECGLHRPVGAADRVRQLVDRDTFIELRDPATSVDFLEFVDSVPYSSRLTRARAATGMSDALLCGTARIGGQRVVLAVMDFRFLGGSLGVAVGEMFCRSADVALAESLPLIVVTASGGARMQEGGLALMQMASTSQALARLREAGLLTVSVITDPTFGGVAASFATSADVVIAEAGSRIGFAGPRVISQTIGQELPPDFQTAEFLLAHGQVDGVEERRDLRGRLSTLLEATQGTPTLDRRRDESRRVVVREPDLLAQRDAWDVVHLARNPQRPTLRDHLAEITDGFVELHGDRLLGDCAAVVAGFGRIAGVPLAVIGHQKGHTTAELIAHNFGMPRPEGYRKARRVMDLAARLGLPILTLVDTPGAHPGLEAEERGQAQAIAMSILDMLALPVPVVTVVTGEGGSGGALALGVADQVLITEHGTYSVISPEGCSSILWNDPSQAPTAARALAITAPELLRLGIVDGVVPEPDGGAHTQPRVASATVRDAVLEVLAPLLTVPGPELLRTRRARYGRFASVAAAQGSAGHRAHPTV